MTNQPPPPPGGTPPAPPPPPPGQYGGGNSPGFDPKTVNALDWGILGAGLLAFIFSFLDYYTASFKVAGVASISGSESAWHGFFGWFAALLALVGAVLVAIDLFAPQLQMPFAARLGGLIAFGLATISVIIALFVFPEDVPDSAGVDTGRGVGYWLSLIVILAGLVLSLMRVQQVGTQLPGALGKLPNIGHYGPQGGISGGQQPPAPPAGGGYGPPPG